MRRRHLVLGGATIVAMVVAAATFWLYPRAEGGGATGPRPLATAAPRISIELPAVLPAPPDRDPYQLAQRLRLKSAEPIPRLANVEPTSYSVGREDVFWVTNVDTIQHFKISATIRYVTPHLYMYVQNGTEVSLDDIRKSADDFENRVYPCVHLLFGSEWTPGVDNDPHLTVLAGAIPGLAGYYSSSDEYPLQVNAFSNQREIFYLNTGAIRLGTAGFVGTMAHEFQHMVHWAADRNEQTWVNEGLSELSADFCGNGPSFVNAFMANPNVQLNSWSEQTAGSGPHYGAAYLFFKYLAGRFGKEAVKDLVAEPKHGIEGIDAWLARRSAETFGTVFKDWVVTNYLNDGSGGRFSYRDLSARFSAPERVTAFGKRDASVKQFAARYYDVLLQDGDAAIRFEGQQRTKFVGGEMPEGSRVWWSNRADGMDSTLTRELDLRNTGSATLSFKVWHSLEKNWDYAYVEVSTDDGKTWNVLPGLTTSSEDPVGNAYGPGWTGTSGGGNQPVWVDERIELTAFAGKKVLVRFETITDDAVNLEGFVVRDISVPEIGFWDGSDSSNGWSADGFFVLKNEIPQQFQVQVVRFGPETVVEDMPLDRENRGEYVVRGFGKSLRHVVVVVSATSPSTTREATYQLSIEPAR